MEPRMTRSQRCTVSPSLALYEPAARMGGVSPSLGSQTHPPPGHFRPLSPSLELAELLPSPRASPCNSPSLGLIPAAAMARPHPPPVILRGHASKARMTTAVCKRASRMARPSDPSTDTAAEAQRIVVLHEHSLREQGRERVIGEVTPQPFKLSVASTGKGPAVRVDTGDAAADAAAQATMNHVRSFHATPLYTPSTHMLTRVPCPQMVSIKSRHVESGTHEPTWLLDIQSSCPQMYGRLAANAIKRCVPFPFHSSTRHVLTCMSSAAATRSTRRSPSARRRRARLTRYTALQTHLHTVPALAAVPSTTKAYRRNGLSTRKASLERQWSASTGCFRRPMSGIASPATHLAAAIAFSRRSL